MYKIFLDMDSTLNEFTIGYTNYYNRMYSEKVVLKNEDLWQYEISKCIPNLLPEEAEKRKLTIFRVPGYWRNIPIKEGVMPAVKWIYDNFDTYILTAPWLDNLNCIKEKIEWVQKYLPFFDTSKIIFSAHKNIIHPNSILIDDKPSNLEEFLGKTIAFDYPFNRDVEVDNRITHWREAIDVLKAYL